MGQQINAMEAAAETKKRANDIQSYSKTLKSSMATVGGEVLKEDCIKLNETQPLIVVEQKNENEEFEYLNERKGEKKKEMERIDLRNANICNAAHLDKFGAG